MISKLWINVPIIPSLSAQHVVVYGGPFWNFGMVVAATPMCPRHSPFPKYITNIGRRDQPIVSGAVPDLYWPCVWTICNVPLHLLYPTPTYKGNPNILTKFKHQQFVHYAYLACFKLEFCCIYLTIGLPTWYYVFQAKLQCLWTSLVRIATTTWRHISW
jgi:hypothetical protein